MSAGRFPQSPLTSSAPPKVYMRVKESQPVATGWGLSLLVDHRVERKNGRGVFDAALNDAAAIYRNVVLSKIR